MAGCSRDSARARDDLEVALIQRAEADSRYRVLVERVPAAVYIDVADPGVSDGGRLAYMSPQIEAIVGYPPEAFLADPELWPGLIHPDDRESALGRLCGRTGPPTRPLRADYRMIAKDGSIVWIHDEAYAMTEGAVAGGRRVSQGLLVDTTDQKRMEAQLLHDALHDPLTGLANRVLFADHVERALASRRGGRTKVALLFLDLDDFKVVNDTLGHRAGDRLLIEVARRLSETIRAGDVAARQGGDEFTVLLDRVHGVDEAVASAERLATSLRRPDRARGPDDRHPGQRRDRAGRATRPAPTICLPTPTPRCTRPRPRARRGTPSSNRRCKLRGWNRLERRRGGRPGRRSSESSPALVDPARRTRDVEVRRSAGHGGRLVEGSVDRPDRGRADRLHRLARVGSAALPGDWCL